MDCEREFGRRAREDHRTTEGARRELLSAQHTSSVIKHL